MEKFLLSMGTVFCILIVSFIALCLSEITGNMIKKIKDSRSTATIKEGTVLFNHDKGIKFKVKKDIEIKFKREKGIKASTVDYSFGCISWGMNKDHAKSKLEDQLVNMVYECYKNNKLSCELMSEYVEGVKELN